MSGPGENGNDGVYAQGRLPTRTYFTARFRDDPERRFAIKVWDAPDSPRFEWVARAREATVEGDPSRVVTIRHEAVLDVSANNARHRYQLKAVFVEGTREIEQVLVQKFTESSGKPHLNFSLAFSWEQTQRLLQFFRAIRYVRLDDGGAKVRVDDTVLDDLLVDDAARARFVRDHTNLVQKLVGDAAALRRAHAVVELGTAQEAVDLIERKGLTTEVLRILSDSGLTNVDLLTLAHRRRQLALFEQLLREQDTFSAKRAEIGKNARPEDVWQRFFEANQWILGYGLRYQFGAAVSRSKLEQTVSGPWLGAHGKRVDALLKTLGVVNSLCFVELKNHDAPLLTVNEIRSGVFPPSSNLVAAIAQVQQTVQSAVSTIGEMIRLRDDEGFEDARPLYNLAPKALVVIGSLKQFENDGRMHVDRIKCFELFRRNMVHPEIVTYDELLERARAIVDCDSSFGWDTSGGHDDLPF